MRYIASMTSVLMLVGCSTHSMPPQPITVVAPPDASLPQTPPGTRLDFDGQFVLSAEQTDHPFARVRLVSIGEGGGTVIQHLDTHRYSQASPGEYFICDELGTNRLKLLSASRDTLEATFAYKWTEWR